MYTFSELIKKIRKEAGLTQAQFANAMGVSTVLIAMIESGQKEVSKKFVIKLAEEMNIHPSSITPFIFVDNNYENHKISKIEQSLINLGEKIQKLLIEDRARHLKKYAN